MKRFLKKTVLNELINTRFPICKTRPNTSNNPTTSFVLGIVNYRGQKFLDGKTKGPSKWNTIHPKLFQLLQELIRSFKPDFQYTTIQVNKNTQCKPHIDTNNVGDSYIIALGNFTGGDLVIESKKFNIRNRFKRFDGHLAHWVEPFEGDRYSLVFFTHTFKPPIRSLANLKITEKAIYDKDNKLIKEY